MRRGGGGVLSFRDCLLFCVAAVAGGGGDESRWLWLLVMTVMSGQCNDVVVVLEFRVVA